MSFGVLNAMRRRTVREAVNPLDKCTVVSIYPKPIHEVKNTIQPGIFDIPAGTFAFPSTLVVGPSSWWREIDEDQPLIEVPISSIAIANSVVTDYANGLFGCNMGDCMPGLFYVVGDKKPIEIPQPMLDAALVKQRAWFNILVKAADTLWARSNGNPVSISDDMRLAAKELNLDQKEWLKDYHTTQLIRCVACGNLNSDKIVVCPNCKVIVDKKKFDELKLSFAS